jgi:tripartite-type tricarboxylate transporter receptor subunit TctC
MMSTLSRLFSRATACTLLSALFVSAAAQAQTYPVKPVRLVVPFSPGGSMDLLARIISIPMAKTLGQSVVVENIPGANGNIGAENVARSAADGYSVLIISDSNTIARAMTPGTLRYDVQKDFVPITFLVSGAHVIVANPETKLTTLAELVDFSTRNPGKLFYSTPGAGSAQHLGMEIFKIRAGKLQIDHVPFKGGGQAITSLVGGQIHLGFLGFTPSLPFIRDKKLNPLAVTGPVREPKLPNVPTMIELGYPNFVSHTWYGVVVPTGTPPAVVARLREAFVSSLEAPGVLERLADAGLVPDRSLVSSADFQKFIADDVALWTRTVQATGIKME